MLSDASSSGVARTTLGAVEFAHAIHTQLRLTEVNSISCGGNRGVANSFATALWTPDVLFELLNAGVDGVNWHIRPSILNAPFNLDDGKLVPLPELYGLAVFAQMTHGPARLVDTTVSASAGLDLKAWTVRRGGTSNVLLINKARRDAQVSVPAPSGVRGAAIIRRLQAPTIGSATGVRFAGRRIGSDGLWHGQENDERVAPVAAPTRSPCPPTAQRWSPWAADTRPRLRTLTAWPSTTSTPRSPWWCATTWLPGSG